MLFLLDLTYFFFNYTISLGVGGGRCGGGGRWWVGVGGGGRWWGWGDHLGPTITTNHTNHNKIFRTRIVHTSGTFFQKC